MKKIITLICALIGASVVHAASTVAVVNYDGVYAKWKEAVNTQAELKTQLDEINVQLSVKVETRDALVRQLNSYGETKPGSEAEAKTLQAKAEAARKALENVTKEIQALDASPELRKRIADTQTALRGKVEEAVRAVAKDKQIDIVLDSSARNVYGLPVVTGISEEITAAVLQKLEAGAK